jgi:hypothetical protein
MELELWKLSRIEFLGLDSENEIEDNSCYDSISDLTSNSLINEIGSSEKFELMAKKFLTLKPPINLWLEDDTINLESTCEKSIRYELFGCEIQDKNMVDAVLMIFESLENIYSIYLNRN